MGREETKNTTKQNQIMTWKEKNLETASMSVQLRPFAISPVGFTQGQGLSSGSHFQYILFCIVSGSSDGNCFVWDQRKNSRLNGILSL